MILRVVFIVFFSLFLIIKCENILILIGIASPSHHLWFKALTNGLMAEGKHNITILGPNVDKNPPTNVHYIKLDKIYDIMNGIENGKKAPAFNRTKHFLNKQTTSDELSMFGKFCNIVCEGAFKTNGMKQILSYPNNFKFDLTIYDYTCGPCLLFLAEKFNNPPIVAATAFPNPPFTTDLIGGHKHVAYVPYYGLKYDSEMNFFERIHNAYAHFLSYRHCQYFLNPSQDTIVRKNIPWDFSYLGDIEKRTILALVNTHPSFDGAEPLTPNTIPVAGLHMEPVKPLPEDLEDFIQNSEKGAVLFSLGTNIKSNQLGAEAQIKFLKAFEQMPQYNFLWKFESDTLPIKVPKNVLIRPWMPQNDLLGHPKVLLFITHAGGLSIVESSWHGKPIIAIPFLVDQHRNAFRSVRLGVAEMIDFRSLTIEEVNSKVIKVIEDPSYRQKMQLRAKRFHDQPESPLNRAVWWINWAIRNPNPDHMISPTQKLGFIRSNIYDIIGAGILVVSAIAYSICKLLSMCRRKIFVEKKIKKN